MPSAPITHNLRETSTQAWPEGTRKQDGPYRINIKIQADASIRLIFRVRRRCAFQAWSHRVVDYSGIILAGRA